MVAELWDDWNHLGVMAARRGCLALVVWGASVCLEGSLCCTTGVSLAGPVKAGMASVLLPTAEGAGVEGFPQLRGCSAAETGGCCRLWSPAGKFGI